METPIPVTLIGGASGVLELALGAAALSACAPTTGGGLPYAAPAAFNERDFGWSQMPGRNSIQGQIAFARDGKAFDCVASVGLTPDTPYTRARIRTLYGSTQRAAVPAAVVRARTVVGRLAPSPPSRGGGAGSGRGLRRFREPHGLSNGIATVSGVRPYICTSI